MSMHVKPKNFHESLLFTDLRGKKKNEKVRKGSEVENTAAMALLVMRRKKTKPPTQKQGTKRLEGEGAEKKV